MGRSVAAGLWKSAPLPFDYTWEHRLAFTVLGVPIPKGSMKAFIFMRGGKPRAAITHDNDKTRGWAEAVAREAFLVRGHQGPIDEPVRLVLRFYMPRPKSAPKRVIVPAKKPDWDKLSRLVGDSLKAAGVYHDDGQVVDGDVIKRFAGGWGDPQGPNGLPRAEIEVARLV